MSPLNLSATFNLFRVLVNPSLCLPHATVSTFNDLPIPLDAAFQASEEKIDIRAVVLDKDDCFAYPKENVVYKDYDSHFARLRAAYPGARLLIVSNTAGSGSSPTSSSLSSTLSAATSVAVLAHAQPKPGCRAEVMAHFRAHPETGVTHPSQVAIVGDRLSTDVVMANLMGARAVWVRDGVVPLVEKSIFARMEHRLADFLTRRGYTAPSPRSPFE